MFTSILEVTGGLTLISGLICTGVSLILGIIIAYVHMAHGSYSKNFTVTLAILPALIQVVIMMVNGNLGTSVAALGAFSLVRFRSAPGNSKEICSIFFAMAIGLATGMGYVTFAVLTTFIIGFMLVILFKTSFGEKSAEGKQLKITIPENLDYTEIFDDIFENLTSKVSLDRVKTTNLGSMYELQYNIVLKDKSKEKELIDQLRCRNGNLPIICGRSDTLRDEL